VAAANAELDKARKELEQVRLAVEKEKSKKTN